MLERKATGDFEAWYELARSEKALLVTGARQVGKTYLIERFAQSRFEHFVKFDMVEQSDVRTSFAAARDADDLALRISVAADGPMVPGKTAVFIDEVQECPEVVTLVKYLVQRGDYSYILSGSRLGVELENIRSIPVGYVQEVKMLAMDFEEYCWACGLSHEVFEIARSCRACEEEIPDFVHKKLLDLYHRYLLVGGMPDAVRAHVEDRGVDEVRKVQSDIHNLYRLDISKYAPRELRLVIREIYDLIPSEISARSRRFRISSIKDADRFPQVSDNFLWLVNAGVALPVYQVTEPTPPLLLTEQRNKFKLFYHDVGLLAGTFTKKAMLGLLDGDAEANLGGVYESAAAQMLVAAGFDLRYFNSKQVGELDFVVERPDGEVVAVEVKSGKQYLTHAALDNAMKIPNWHIDEAVVLAETNVFRKDGILYLPVYCALVL